VASPVLDSRQVMHCFTRPGSLPGHAHWTHRLAPGSPPAHTHWTCPGPRGGWVWLHLSWTPIRSYTLDPSWSQGRLGMLDPSWVPARSCTLDPSWSQGRLGVLHLSRTPVRSCPLDLSWSQGGWARLYLSWTPIRSYTLDLSWSQGRLGVASPVPDSRQVMHTGPVLVGCDTAILYPQEVTGLVLVPREAGRTAPMLGPSHVGWAAPRSPSGHPHWTRGAWT
jgi:hypothetical protein